MREANGVGDGKGDTYSKVRLNSTGELEDDDDDIQVDLK